MHAVDSIKLQVGHTITFRLGTALITCLEQGNFQNLGWVHAQPGLYVASPLRIVLLSF